MRTRDGLLIGVELAASTPLPASRASTPLLATVVGQLHRYFEDPRAGFDLPLADDLTPFQRRIRAALIAIPPGEQRSYGALAETLGSSARAVGGACRRNPLPIIVPCHRVVARAGRGGFMGQTNGPALAIKSWLLRHEQKYHTHAGRLL